MGSAMAIRRPAATRTTGAVASAVGPTAASSRSAVWPVVESPVAVHRGAPAPMGALLGQRAAEAPPRVPTARPPMGRATGRPAASPGSMGATVAEHAATVPCAAGGPRWPLGHAARATTARAEPVDRPECGSARPMDRPATTGCPLRPAMAVCRAGTARVHPEAAASPPTDTRMVKAGQVLHGSAAAGRAAAIGVVAAVHLRPATPTDDPAAPWTDHHTTAVRRTGGAGHLAARLDRRPPPSAARAPRPGPTIRPALADDHHHDPATTVGRIRWRGRWFAG